MAEEVVEDLEAKKLDEKNRKGLSTGEFAFPRLRKLPIHDASHVRNAMSRFNQTQGWTSEEKKAAKAKIIRKAKQFGIDVGDFGKVSASAEPWTLVVEAKSLDLPVVDGHPNRMPFSGVLTKVGVASDKAPNGSDGKRVLLTQECCEDALDSLLGMGVDLAIDMKGHAPQTKVGVITGAYIDGEDLCIEGFIYASDFPREALKIHLQQADLGFSFEAQSLRVESMDADPLVVKSCVFTGAAILMKDAAAYQTTALAASKAKEHEMEEQAKLIADAVASALAPISEQLKSVVTAQKEHGDALEAFKKDPPHLQAVSAAVSKVEPHAANLEGVADKMEAAGVGLHETAGHVAHLRRMASSMRAAAHMGQIPSSYHDSGSYWASGQQPAPQQAAAVPAIEDSPQFKALSASFDKLQKDFADQVSAQETKLKDMKAAADAAKGGPDRKTFSPAVMGILSKVGVEAPADGATLQSGVLDRAFASTNMSTGQKLAAKLALQKEGLLNFTGAA